MTGDMASAFVALLLMVSLRSPACDGANILAAFPVPGKSHWIVFSELLLELSRRGHNLTVISHFTLDQPPPPNWEQITVGAYHEELPSEHKNTKLFITHGGLMSIQEAISAGVPLLGIPVFGDQQVNVGRAAREGLGIMLTMDNVTERSFSWALSELLVNPRYQEAAQRKSVVFHDRPQKPLETAVYWVEYVLRHDGAPHMRSASLHLSWYQYLLLDVAAFVLAMLFLVLAVVALVATALVRSITKSISLAQTRKKRIKKE